MQQIPMYTGVLFKIPNTRRAQLKPNANIELLIKHEVERLVNTYHTETFDAAQLKQILNIGANNVYRLLRGNELPVITIGKRRVVSAVALASYLICGYGGEKMGKW